MKFISQTKFQSVLLCNLLLLSVLIEAKSAITYQFSGGRFGDNLLSYCHAKWLSYSLNIPFYYRPFEYSNQLTMHTHEVQLTNEIMSKFDEVININISNVCNIDPNKNVLYIIPFFSESIVEREQTLFPYLFAVNWDDLGFKKILCKMISPAFQLRTAGAGPQEGLISVALHIRIGTGFDINGLKDYWWIMTQKWVELKFPPLPFYIHALERIKKHFSNQKLYVYLFTDHNDPQELVEIIEQEMDCQGITFDYRREQNCHNINVLEDFFSLISFDCLIRSDSNFSLVASKLADYKMQISPWHINYDSGLPVVDEICVNNQIIRC